MASGSHEKPLQLRIITCHVGFKSFGFHLELEVFGFQLELEVFSNFWNWNLVSVVILVQECVVTTVKFLRCCTWHAMGFFELVFVLWTGLLIWCVVMVNRIYDEVKRQKPSQGEGIEKSTQFPVWTSSSTTRATRRASTQTSWEDMEFLMAPHGKVLHRPECRYLERCSKTIHLCQICFNR